MPETPDHAQIDSGVATSLDQSTESHLENLQRAAIGPINAHYYLPLLARFEADGRASPSWNWAACVNTLNWMVFRGMWMPALLYGTAVAGAALGVQAVIALSAPMTASLQWSMWAALTTLALLVPGFFGNVWLHGVYRQRLEKALTATSNLKDAGILLASWASSQQRQLAIAVANLILAVVIVTWAWPSDLNMRMWPRASGSVQDIVPSAVESAPVVQAESNSGLESAAPPEVAAGASLQALPDASELADPPSGTASGVGPSSSDAVSEASSKQTATRSAAAASAATDSTVAAVPASAAVAKPTANRVSARASSPADSASAPAPDTDVVVAGAPTVTAAETTASTAVQAGSAPALSVAPGATASAAQAQSPPPADALLQPLGPSARAAAKKNAAIAAYARAARLRPAPVAESQPQPQSQPRSEPSKRAKAAVAAATKETSQSGDFVINVGLFAQQDNAQRTHARLEKAGLPAISDTLQMRSGERTRVRVGPFTTEAQAEAAAKRVRDLQLDAIVVQR